MSFRDLLETAQALSLANRLYPDEAAIWHKYCRAYSKTFSEPLSKVLEMDPLTVFSAVFSDNLDEWDIEERLQETFDLIYSLQDPNYDAKKEAAIREEIRQIEERERIRLEKGEAIHPSLAKEKHIITKDQSPKKETPPKELPKSGGIRMDLINKLNNSDNEG